MIFLNSDSSAGAVVFYLPFSGPSMKPGVHTPRENRETPKSGIYFKIFGKTQYLLNTCHVLSKSMRIKVRYAVQSGSTSNKAKYSSILELYGSYETVKLPLISNNVWHLMDKLFLKSNETVKNPSIFVSNLAFNIVDLLIKQLIKI